MTEKEEPIAPLVHLNGTAGKELYGQLADAIKAVRVAHEALTQAWPNGRDYYPLGSDALGKAEVQAAARSEKLRAVIEELDQIRDNVHNQIAGWRR